MKVLVTGGAGYLGSVLLPMLIAKGHQIRVIDIGYFGLEHIRGLPGIDIIQDDLRRVCADPVFSDRLLKEIDCAIHLAGISNDPSAELNPDLTEEVNILATVALARQAKQRGIQFLFSSSCSVYGEAAGYMFEDSALNPLTVYAESKLIAEQNLERMADHDWQPISLRNGTLFGYSPRMRFDLVVNTFALESCLSRQIKLFGGGKQWRPFLHVADCAEAFLHFAEAPRPGFRAVNVAYNNYRVVDIAEIMSGLVPGLRMVSEGADNPDARNYRVSTSRLQSAGFRACRSVEEGAHEVLDSIAAGQIADLESPCHWNAQWVKSLLQNESAVSLATHATHLINRHSWSPGPFMEPGLPPGRPFLPTPVQLRAYRRN